MSDFFNKILNPFGLELGTIFNSFGFSWYTPEEMPLQNTNQQTKKRKLVDEWETLNVTQELLEQDSFEAQIAQQNSTDKPKVKKQKLEHPIVTHSVAGEESQQIIPVVQNPITTRSAFDFTNDSSDEGELEQEYNILLEPKILPSRLPKPKDIRELDKALQQLEQYHHRKLIDLDIGDCSLERILLPLQKNKYTLTDAWLSDFFIINFAKENMVSLGKNDILLYDFRPDNTNLYSNMRRVTEHNKGKGINKIIWPICHGQHFYLITINYDPIKNTVYLHALDGFNSKNQQQEYLNKANNLAELFYPQADFYMKIPQKIVPQRNAMDCAVVACYYISHFIKQTASEFHDWANTYSTPKTIEGMQTQPYTPYRKKIAEAFFAAGNRQLPEVQPPQEKQIGIDLTGF